jgi:hypothetical protein
MITEKEIEQAAIKYAIQEKSSYSSFVDGANFVLKNMDREMCLFAEWRDEQITGSWIDEDNVKKYRTRDKHGRVKYLSTPELLQIYKNREK